MADISAGLSLLKRDPWLEFVDPEDCDGMPAPLHDRWRKVWTTVKELTVKARN